MVTRILIALAVATLASGVLGMAPGTHAAETIRVATEASYPPFSKTEPDGRITGFEIDLGNEVCKRVQIKCEWVKQNFDGYIAGLLAGKYRMIFSSLLINEERQKILDFSIPYQATSYRFVGPKGLNIDISPEQLKGKRIGVYAGSAQEKYLKREYGDTVKLAGYQTIDQIMSDLTAGRIDLALNEEPAAAEFLKSSQGQAFEFIGSRIDDPAVLGVGAAFRKGDELRERINTAIREIYADGTFDTIAAPYFGEVSVRADSKW
jgi:lysine-arginine-ornithine-binding protein